jgi:molybdate transport system regulatory protein
MPSSPPSPKPARHRASAEPPAVRFHMRIIGDEVAVGPGKIALVEAIERTGSLTAAAKSMDMSYRRAWLLLDELNRSLKQPAVVAARGGVGGGGSEITESGRRLVALYRRIETVSAEANKADIRLIMGLLAR